MIATRAIVVRSAVIAGPSGAVPEPQDADCSINGLGNRMRTMISPVVRYVGGHFVALRPLKFAAEESLR